MDEKKYYETPSIEIIKFPKDSILTVSGGEFTPEGEYGDNWQ